VLSVGMRPFQLYEDVKRNARLRQFFKEEVQRTSRHGGEKLGARRRGASEVKREKR
jgi:hypothetical protein